jgi:predicted porin
MQKKLLTAAVAAALATPFAAQAQATLFGIVDVGYQNVSKYAPGANNKSAFGNSGWKSSRLGVRGAENLGGGLQAIYHIEFDIQGDTGATPGAGMTQRATYVGLANEKSWGTISLGRQLTHNFHVTSLAEGTAGHNGFGTYYGMEDMTTRASNYAKYSSPNWGGFTVGIGWAPGEDATPVTEKNNGDYFDLALIYKKGGLKIGYGMSDTKTNTAAAAAVAFAAGPPTVLGTAAVAAVNRKEKDRTIAGGYDFGKFAIAAIHTTSKHTTEDFRLTGIRGEMKLGKGTLALSYGNRKNKLAAASDSKLTAIMYYHNLSKRTGLYGGYARMNNEAGGALGLGGQNFATTAGSDPRGIQLGVVHAF